MKTNISYKIIEDKSNLLPNPNLNTNTKTNLLPTGFELDDKKKRILYIYSYIDETIIFQVKSNELHKKNSVIRPNNKLKLIILNQAEEKWEIPSIINPNESPIERSFWKGCKFNDYILLIGGLNKSGYASSSYILHIIYNSLNDIHEFKWQSVSYDNIHSSFLRRSFFSLSKLNSYALCYGGLENNNILDDFFLINKDKVILLDSKEENISDDPGRLYAHSSIILNNILYIHGGIFFNDNENLYEVSDKLYSLNLTTKEWSIIMSNQSDQRAFHSIVQLNEDSFVIYGGCQTVFNEISGLSYMKDYICKDFRIFSIITNQWYSINIDFPIDSRLFSSIISEKEENRQGKIIIFGGIVNMKEVNTYNSAFILYFNEEYEGKYTIANDMVGDNDDIILSIKEKIDYLENENLTVDMQIKEMTMEIEKYKKKEGGKSILKTGKSVKEKEVDFDSKVIEIGRMRKNTDDMEMFYSKLRRDLNKKKELVEVMKRKNIKMMKFSDNNLSLIKEYIVKLDEIGSSK